MIVKENLLTLVNSRGTVLFRAERLSENRFGYKTYIRGECRGGGANQNKEQLLQAAIVCKEDNRSAKPSGIFKDDFLTLLDKK